MAATKKDIFAGAKLHVCGQKRRNESAVCTGGLCPPLADRERAREREGGVMGIEGLSTAHVLNI
jgi:hypothetical protein